MKKITKKMNMMEIVNINPRAGEILMKAGMHCIGCQMAMFETLDQGCKAHGMNEKQIEKIIKDLNKSKTKKKGD